jgi:hypothetical protein
MKSKFGLLGIENVSSFISNLTSTMAAVGNDCFRFDKYEKIFFEENCWSVLTKPLLESPITISWHIIWSLKSQ